MLLLHRYVRPQRRSRAASCLQRYANTSRQCRAGHTKGRDDNAEIGERDAEVGVSPVGSRQRRCTERENSGPKDWETGLLELGKVRTARALQSLRIQQEGEICNVLEPSLTMITEQNSAEQLGSSSTRQWPGSRKSRLRTSRRPSSPTSTSSHGSILGTSLTVPCAPPLERFSHTATIPPVKPLC